MKASGSRSSTKSARAGPVRLRLNRRAKAAKVIAAPARSRLADGGAREFIAIAAEALGRYKLRTSLSVLGVVFGVAAVIAMMSVSDGARREALAQVEAMGLDNLVVRSRPAGASAATATTRLTARDAQRLVALVPWAQAASPLDERIAPVSRAGTRLQARVVG